MTSPAWMESRRRRPQLGDEAAAYLRELIMSGQLQPGEFLRPERLAEELGMSATPLREALLSLRAEGFVLLAPRKGFTVAPLSIQDVADLYCAQSLLAGELAARACAHITDEDLRRLRELQLAMEAAAKEEAHDRMEVINHDFHRTVNTIAESPKLAWALSVTTRYVPRRFYATIPGWPTASLHDHSSVIAALAERDPDGARSSMARHVTHAGVLLGDNLKKIREAEPATTH